MIKKVTTDRAGTIEGDNIKLIDVANGCDYVNHGQVNILDPSGDLQGSFQEEDEVTVEVGVISEGQEITDTIFTGFIESATKESMIILKLDGKGRILRKNYYKKSYHLIDPGRIMRDILGSVSGLSYQLGSMPSGRRHTWICPNGPLMKEINRVNLSFDLNLVPFFNREGTLVLKTLAEALNTTSVNFEDGTFQSFKNDILKTELDVELKVFDQIQILSLLYIITFHRMIVSDEQSTSIIGVTKN